MSIALGNRILVIEDTEDNRRILRDVLTNSGFEVIEAIDGEKGIAAAAEHRPDLILMDIQMPIIDGYEATRRIKANPDLRHIPIIAITSFALAGDEEKTAAAGCDGYIPKPCSPRQVLAMVRDLHGKIGASGNNGHRRRASGRNWTVAHDLPRLVRLPLLTSLHRELGLKALDVTEY